MNNKLEEALKYCHEKSDPKENLETTPPSDEKIRILCIWAFEVFPPEYIENFDKSIEKLGWGEEKIEAADYFQETLYSMRHQNYARGWINLGYIVDESNESIMSGVRKGKLPKGVKQINASIFQPIPSTTILICQFIFQDELACNIEKVLRKEYKTYLQENKKSVSFIRPENQKRNAIKLELEFLNSICSNWLKENFNGLYSYSFINENHPTCHLITLEKNIPFEKNDDTRHYNSYMSILNLNNIYDGWIDKKQNGLYLSISSWRDSVRKSLVLSYNEQSNKILEEEHIKMYGYDKSSATLNSLTHGLDNNLGIWVLNVLLNSYSYKINSLRDLYGNSNKKNFKQSLSTLSELDHEVVQVQKNIIPFISEMKYFCKDNSNFIGKEFISLANKTNSISELFQNIKSSIQFQIELLEQNQKMLKETSTAVREVNGLLVSDKIAETNIKLQKSIKLMTIVILILTCITTFYSLPDDKRENITSYFQNLSKR